jgi:hypothetical protein
MSTQNSRTSFGVQTLSLLPLLFSIIGIILELTTGLVDVYFILAAFYAMPTGVILSLIILILYLSPSHSDERFRSLLVFGVSLSIGGALYYAYWMICCASFLG